ncbi:hypothetical protein ACWGDX_05300 [Streptomyces sp. NPDC055025]
MDPKSVDAFGFTPGFRLAAQWNYWESTIAATEANALIAREKASLGRGLLPAPYSQHGRYPATPVSDRAPPGTAA